MSIRRVAPSSSSSPRNILEEIVWHKAEELVALRARESDEAVLTRALEARQSFPPRDFVGALRAMSLRSPSGVGLIAEVKQASPSRGVICRDWDPARIGAEYQAGGAACLSVLTDERYFKGAMGNLTLVRSAGVTCPLLAKEFVVSARQLCEARAAGADAALLIAAVLEDAEIEQLLRVCAAIGLHALVETHTVNELDRVAECLKRLEREAGDRAVTKALCGSTAAETDPEMFERALSRAEQSDWSPLRTTDTSSSPLSPSSPERVLIGVNNRSLETFKVDLNTTKTVLASESGKWIRERGHLAVCESGIFTPKDVQQAVDAGSHVILVGESLVKQGDRAKGVKALVG